MNKINNKANTKYIFIKSLCDIFFSFAAIIFFLPLFIIISLLVKFSSRGHIFYYQKRVGKNKKDFYCIKFRTMHPEAEDILKNILNQDLKLKNEFINTHKLKNDPRITSFGKFLRKTSLDEIPQFFNVLKGDMSIVGPRPIVKEEINKYGKNFKKINSMKPGITGLWQISGRNNLSYSKRVSLDMIYSKDISFIMDLRIIIRTVGVILFPSDRGSY